MNQSRLKSKLGFIGAANTFRSRIHFRLTFLFVCYEVGKRIGRLQTSSSSRGLSWVGVEEDLDGVTGWNPLTNSSHSKHLEGRILRHKRRASRRHPAASVSIQHTEEEEEDGPYTDGIKGRVSKWHISIGRVKFKLNSSAKSINHDWVAAGYY